MSHVVLKASAVPCHESRLAHRARKTAIAGRELLFAFGPWHALDGHPARWALHPPHRVDEEHRNVPQRHKLEPSSWKPVVAGPLLAATRADRPAVGPGLDVHLDLGGSTGGYDQSFPLVDERLERLDVIEDT